jgi:hypothetical protein
MQNAIDGSIEAHSDLIPAGPNFSKQVRAFISM